MVIEPGVIAAILAIFGIGVVGIVQSLKVLLKLEGTAALILTAVVSFLSTAIYLWQTSAFSIFSLVAYGILVFGEASGLYKVFNTTRNT